MGKLIQTFQGVALALVLGLAVTVLTWFVFQLAPGVYVDLQKSRMAPEELATWSKGWSESIEFSQEGQPVIQLIHFDRGEPSHKTIALFDLEHKPIKEPLASELNGLLLPWSSIGCGAGKILKLHLDMPIPRGRRVSRLNWDHGKTEAWYFVYGGPKRGQGPGWFEGYDRRTCDLLGYLGPQGFTDIKPKEKECFQVIAGSLQDGMNSSSHFMMTENFSRYRERHLDGRDDVASGGKIPIEQSQILILSDGRIWSVDLKERTVRFLSDDTGVQAMSIAGRFDPPSEEHPADKPEAAADRIILSQFVALRFGDRIKFINPKLGTPFELQIPDEMRDSTLIYYLSRSGAMVVESLLTYSGHETEVETGILERNHKIVRIHPDNTQESWAIKTHRSAVHEWISKNTRWWFTVWQIPAPLPSLLIVTLGHAAIHWPNLEQSFTSIMWEGFENAWPALVALCFFSGMLVWLADRWLANHRLPRNHAWLAFVFLFGLPGAIGFLLHRKWPVCNPLPPPERTGIEIFA